MLNKKSTHFKSGLLVLLTILFISCENNKRKTEIEQLVISSTINRFDVDLFSAPQPLSESTVLALRNKYGEFFDLFCSKIIRIPGENDSVCAANLNQFINDPDVVSIKKKCNEVFPDITDLSQRLKDMLRHYHYYFPAKPVPDIVTYISAFNYTVITTDSVLGIGLDMYLGKDCEFYPALGLPKYMTDKLSGEYILRDVIKALFQSDYDPDQVDNQFLSQIVYHGKLLYVSALLNPEEADTITIGYSNEQLKWCNQNEANIWGFMIENNLLYSREVSRYIRYLNDGNTTQGLPKEAPAKLGAWIGWQVIRAYMKKHPDMKLEKLLLETDAQKILSESGYKPEK